MMTRLTHLRSNGIRSGYWSPNKKEELVQKLAAYEDTGLEPEEIESRNSPQIIHDLAFGKCPVCGMEFNSELVYEYEIRHCPFCGQKLNR